jgi:hypothetical protein
MTIICHSCNDEFTDYEALAKHIVANRKGHRKGKKWANGYLLKVKQLNAKKDFKYIPETPEDRENKASCIRELSGETQFVKIICPSCKVYSQQKLPIEYIQSKEAWRGRAGTLVVNCLDCQKTS